MTGEKEEVNNSNKSIPIEELIPIALSETMSAVKLEVCLNNSLIVC